MWRKVDQPLSCVPPPIGEDTLMRTAGEFIEEAKASGLTYYRIAKLLGVSNSHLLAIRHGTTPLTEAHAETLAELLELDAGLVYAEAKAARAKRTEVRAFWERVARSLAASLVLVLVGVFGHVPDARAGAAATAPVIHYAHRNRRRRFLGCALSHLRAMLRRGTARSLWPDREGVPDACPA